MLPFHVAFRYLVKLICFTIASWSDFKDKLRLKETKQRNTSKMALFMRSINMYFGVL